MQAVSPLREVFDRYKEIGGVLDFAVFEDAEGDEKSAIEAIASIIKGIDQTKLLLLGSSRIQDGFFYGDWYSAAEDALVKSGHWLTSDGRKLLNPKLRDLEGVSIVSGSHSIPDEGSGGQFAYAFCQPPYPLSASPRQVEDLFNQIRGFVLPPNMAHEIWDWSSPRLAEVSDYFLAGMQWWGVFLFTIYVPELRRLTAIAGSTTD